MHKFKNFIKEALILVRGSFFILNHPANRGNPIKAILKMIYWKFNKHFFKKDLIIEIYPGVKCICPYWSSYGGIIYMTRNPEYYETEIFLKVLQEDSTVFDVGCNIGYYTLLAAGRATAGKVFSFDVDPRISKITRKNIKLNNFSKRVTFINSLVSDKEGTEDFVCEKESEMSHIAYRQGPGTKKYRAVTLDSFSSRKHLKRVRIAKIDIEGAEFKVIRGMKKLIIENRIDYLIIELNKNIHLLGSTHEELMGYLRKCGYNIFIHKNKGFEKMESIKVEKNDINKNILAVSPLVLHSFKKISVGN